MIDSPAPADPASAWMRDLEHAHRCVLAAAAALDEVIEPRAHLQAAARRIELGFTAIYDAFDGRADRPTAIGQAHARLWDAAILVARAGLPGALASLREACSALITAEERYPRVPLAAPVVGPIQAGVETLPLHWIARASLRPALRAPPEPEIEEARTAVVMPEPTTFEELAQAAEAARRVAAAQRVAMASRRAATSAPAALAQGAMEAIPPGYAFAPKPALTDDAFVQRWARECFEEIGMLGVQRTPLIGDAFRSSLAIERRMVHAVDAIAALGAPALACLPALALDAPAVNPMSVFAIALLGGCIEGRDLLGSAERVLARFGPGDPQVAGPFASAMKLAPNPFVEGAMRSLLASPSPGARALAVEVLAARGWLGDAELSALAEDEDSRVLALVLPALAAARHPDLDLALGRALPHPDLRVQAAALDAMAIAAHPRAASAARAAATGALGERALVRLALVASEDDARWLLDRMSASPTPAAVEAVGWAGLGDAIPALIGLLSAEEPKVRRMAGAALDRLLGAQLTETIVIAPEALEEVAVIDPDPEPRPPRAPLSALVEQLRDDLPPGSPETMVVPSTDPEAWRAHWSAHGRDLDRRQRLRRGRPYAPSVALQELDRLPLPPEDRRRLHREIAARTGKLTAFDPHDFVRIQEQSLAAWAALVRASAEVPGAWGRPLGSRR